MRAPILQGGSIPSQRVFFLLTFEFRFDIIITELIEKQPIDAYVLEMTETTIGRGDAPTLPPSGLWSSEEGWAD